MYSVKPILVSEHLAFLINLKTDDTKKFFLIRRKGCYIGVYNLFNIKNREGESGFYIAPEMQEKNLSVEFCYFTFSHLFKNHIEKIYGYALTSNKNANSLNKLFGFSQVETTKSVNGTDQKYYYGELNRQTWNEKVSSNPRILQLVEYSLRTF